MSSVSRQRLRPWLISRLNNGDIDGLFWLDKEKLIFRIPWKHGGKQDWEPRHSMVFKEWARSTGKYCDGVDPLEWAKWKTRLRCAFNKAPDITELKHKSDTTGPEPFRIYQFKDRDACNAAASIKIKAKREPRVKQEVKREVVPTEPEIPDLDAFHSSKSVELPHDLQDLPSGELMLRNLDMRSITITSSPIPSFGDLSVEDRPVNVVKENGDVTSELITATPQLSDNTLIPPQPDTSSVSNSHGALLHPSGGDPMFGAGSPEPGDLPGPVMATAVEVQMDDFQVESSPDVELLTLQQLPSNMDDTLSDLKLQLHGDGDLLLQDAVRLLVTEESAMPNPVKGHEMHVRVQYLGADFSSNKYIGNIVYEDWVLQKVGCRLHYRSDDDVRSFMSQHDAEEVLGPFDACNIELPPCQGIVPDRLQEYTQMLLDNITRGILIECDNGTIYATRLCKCVVYFCNQTQITSVKLKRNKRTVIFKLQDFKVQLDSHLCNNGGPPSSEVRLSFGQMSNYINHSSSTYLSVFITSAQAEAMLSKSFHEEYPGHNEEEMQISEPDDNDNSYERIMSVIC